MASVENGDCVLEKTLTVIWRKYWLFSWENGDCYQEKAVTSIWRKHWLSLLSRKQGRFSGENHKNNIGMSSPGLRVKEVLYVYSQLTHWGRVTHISISKLTSISSNNGLTPTSYLNQWWNVVNWNKLQWNLKQNSYIFIQENAFEMSSEKWRSFCLDLNVLSVYAARPSHFVPTQRQPGHTGW